MRSEFGYKEFGLAVKPGVSKHGCCTQRLVIRVVRRTVTESQSARHYFSVHDIMRLSYLPVSS